MRQIIRHYCLLVLKSFLFLLVAASWLNGQDGGREEIFFHAKVFTGDPSNPYANSVAIRGEKIIAVGSLAETAKTVSANAERIDLEGKSLFPGFIDSHSHSIDGGLGLIAADASEKVQTLSQLPPFVDGAKKTGKGMRGDVLEIFGMPLEFWSHLDVLNEKFSQGTYEKQFVLLRGMDGHTAWANRALLQRAGITPEFLKRLSAQQRSYYGVEKKHAAEWFSGGRGVDRIEPLLPPFTPEKLLAAGRAALAYNYSLGITAWLDPGLPTMFCRLTSCWRIKES